MKHAQTKALFAYWNEMRGNREAPERAEIDPAAIGALLADVFILEVASKSSFIYRLAGTRVCSAFGTELSGRDFLQPWKIEDRAALSTLLWSVIDEAAAAVAGWRGVTRDGRDFVLETLLLPLLLNGDRSRRVLGATCAFDQPFWLGADSVVAAELISLRLLWPDGLPTIVPDPVEVEISIEPARVGHLAVYQGGRR